MKNIKATLKSITTAILTTAILVTGINFGTPAVANAQIMSLVPSVPTYDGNKKKTITLKPGETKQFTVKQKTTCMAEQPRIQHHCEGLDCQKKWTVSDENVVKAELGSDPKDARIDTLDIIGVGTGTATITLICKHDHTMGCAIIIPVKVSLPKATAKQKKCKHKYKTTKKATCERNGIKTCKKCKYQKEIKKIAHKYITESVPVTTHTGFWFIRECGCDKFQVKVKFIGQISGDSVYTTLNDKTAYVAPDSPYPSLEAAFTAMEQHSVDDGCLHPILGSFVEWEEEFGSQSYYETQTICKYCGREKQNIEAAEPK